MVETTTQPVRTPSHPTPALQPRLLLFLFERGCYEDLSCSRMAAKASEAAGCKSMHVTFLTVSTTPFLCRCMHSLHRLCLLCPPLPFRGCFWSLKLPPCHPGCTLFNRDVHVLTCGACVLGLTDCLAGLTELLCRFH